MLYCNDRGSYNLEECIKLYANEWQQILFNVMKVKIALLSNSKHRIKLKEVDIEGIVLEIINDAVSIFDKFLTNTKEYKKYPIIDGYDGTDITLEQNIDYRYMLSPFRDFFDKIEVR